MGFRVLRSRVFSVYRVEGPSQPTPCSGTQGAVFLVGGEDDKARLDITAHKPSDLREVNLGHFQVGSYRYRSLIEGLYTLQKPYRSPLYPKLPTCSFLYVKVLLLKFGKR